MDNKHFINEALKIVQNYVEEHTDTKVSFECYVVWNCYILGSQKALLSTTLRDGMYFEVTYNAQLNQIYLDAYKKIENRCIECQ